METFKLAPEGIKSLIRTTMFKTIPSLLLLIVLGGAIALFSQNDPADLKTLIPILTIIFLILVFVVIRIMSNQIQHQLESYELTIEADKITRRQHPLVALSILNTDLQEIAKYPNGSLIVKGKSAKEVIGIPAEIENYDKLLELLSRHAPITIASNLPFYVKYRLLITGFMGLTIGTLYLATNKALIALAGCTIVSVLVYSFIVIQKDKQIDQTIKNRAFIVWLVIFSVISYMYIKLME